MPAVTRKLFSLAPFFFTLSLLLALYVLFYSATQTSVDYVVKNISPTLPRNDFSLTVCAAIVVIALVGILTYYRVTPSRARPHNR